MKKILNSKLVLLALPIMFIAGCASSDKTFLSSADQFVNKTVGPEYVGYVTKDPNLTENDKKDRLLNVESFKKVVAAKLNEGN